VVQPAHVTLFEDYNVPRGIEHAVSTSADVPVTRHLYTAPGPAEREWFAARAAEVNRFTEARGVLVQAWSAFGMDAAVWLAGTEGAIMLAMDTPDVFTQLLNIIAQTDYARTELAAQTQGIDMVVMRGWYSSTDFWSPSLFDKYVYPYVAELAALTHKYGKKFAYVMTTGVEVLGPKLADAGVDVLCFVDPVQDKISLEKAKELLGDRIAVAGGTNALSLASGDPARIRSEVKRAIEILGPTGRFILHPVDALFPDTPWQGVEQMIEAWKEYR
jgi:uroporphyrinogen-III decarboxylase